MEKFYKLHFWSNVPLSHVFLNRTRSTEEGTPPFGVGMWDDKCAPAHTQGLRALPVGGALKLASVNANMLAVNEGSASFHSLSPGLACFV